MGLWALAGGLNNLRYGNITACRMNDALQCLCWGVINMLTINNNYKKERERIKGLTLTRELSSKKSVFLSGLKVLGFFWWAGPREVLGEDQEDLCACTNTDVHTQKHACLHMSKRMITCVSAVNGHAN